jgi:hypothetical protein
MARMKPKGLSITELAREFEIERKQMYAILKDVPADKRDTSGARYSLKSVLYPLLKKCPEANDDVEISMSPIDKLNFVKAEREELKLHEEMGKLGKAEDWDTQAAEAMKSLGNSLDGLPDFLTERLGLDNEGFDLCQRVVDGFRTTLYNNLILGSTFGEENDE